MRRVNNSRPTSFQPIGFRAIWWAQWNNSSMTNEGTRRGFAVVLVSFDICRLFPARIDMRYVIVCVYILILYRESESAERISLWPSLGYMFNIFHVLFVWNEFGFFTFIPPHHFLDIPPHSYNLRSTERDPHCIPHSIEYEFKFKYYYGTISAHRVYSNFCTYKYYRPWVLAKRETGRNNKKEKKRKWQDRSETIVKRQQKWIPPCLIIYSFSFDDDSPQNNGEEEFFDVV